MNERRQQKRYRCTLLVRFVREGRGEWAAVSRNVSPRGLMMAVGPKLKVGDPLTVTFRVKPDTPEVSVSGKITRVLENAEDPRGYWPHQVAVEFEEAQPELEALLQEVEE
jgi:hypothetical protein